MTWTDRWRRNAHDRSSADGLFALGDISVSGGDSPTGDDDLDDLGDTLLLVQRTLGDSSTSVEPATRRRIWEEIMHARVEEANALGDRNGIGRRVHPGETSPLRPSTLATTVVRWQPTISFLVVVAFLVSLIGLAYNRGIWGDTGTLQQPDSELDPFTPDRPTPAEPPVSDVTCTPRTEGRLSDNDLRVYSIDDWNPPTYYNARPAAPEIGQMAIDTYLAFSQCEFEHHFGTPSAASDASDFGQTYRSDRMRYLLLYDTLTPEHQRDVDEFLADNPSDEILESFPLPLNRDINTAIAVGDGAFFTEVFTAGEVYELPDGRYGAILGSISTQMLVEQRPVREGDGAMMFVAFWPEDGQLYIDEMLGLCVPGLVPFSIPADATPVGTGSSEEAAGLSVYPACT